MTKVRRWRLTVRYTNPQGKVQFSKEHLIKELLEFNSGSRFVRYEAYNGNTVVFQWGVLDSAVVEQFEETIIDPENED